MSVVVLAGCNQSFFVLFVIVVVVVVVANFVRLVFGELGFIQLDPFLSSSFSSRHVSGG
jgi:hypothetical protein